ncbi:AAA family ATPase [Desulfosediminicola ganghwensis]|uniref:AAA family ATPase n=1 Tax=Desulfosediminicola ganghwensis TaxID=2569540 RepID=UPI0010AB8725|nr:AAA family ATPase [Desulfosediminicola ganghwensis]
MKIDDKMTEATPKEFSPFSEEFIPQNFHPEIGRLNLLKNIRQDLAEGVPMVVVTGEAGSGKSVIGKMVANESVDGCRLIYFSKTVLSFENVVKVVARIVGVEVTDLTRKGVAAAVGEIAESAASLPERLTLVFDGAERIYLATLERIRKMLDMVNANNFRMQILFIGRPGLLENLEQLHICNLNEVVEKRYGLQPLSESETALYIEMCTGRLAQVDAGSFTTEAVARINQVSRGNFRKINSCADEVLKRGNSGASFCVMLENAESGEGGTGAGIKGAVLPGPGGYSNKKMLMAGGAIVATLAVVFVLVTGNKKESYEPIEAVAGQRPIIEEPETILEQASAEIGLTERKQPEQGTPAGHDVIVDNSAGLENEPTTINEIEIDELVALKSELPEGAAEASTLKQEASGVADLSEDSSQIVKPDLSKAYAEEADKEENSVIIGDDDFVKEVVSIVPQPTVGKKIIEERVTRKPVTLKKGSAKRIVAEETESSESQGGAEEIVAEIDGTVQTEAESVVEGLSNEDIDLIFEKSLDDSTENIEFQPGAPVTEMTEVKPASTEHLRAGQDTVGTVSAEPKKVIKPAEATVSSINIQGSNIKKVPEMESAVIESSVTKVDLVTDPGLENEYFRRLAAGENWLHGESDSKYTMQLMVLSAENAQENIEQMLDAEEYRQEADNFFILEDRQNSGQVYVFYGEYETMEAARMARDAISDALREHSPYVLSVPVAVQKLL